MQLAKKQALQPDNVLYITSGTGNHVGQHFLSQQEIVLKFDSDEGQYKGYGQ